MVAGQRLEAVTVRRGRSGMLPGALLSSRPYDCNGIVVELYRIRRVDIMLQSAEHVVSVLLRGPINLLQSRNGLVAQTTMHAGDVIITPIGEPKRWCHEEEAEILMLRLAPSLLETIIVDIDTSDGDKVELLDNFGTRDPHIESLAMRLLVECTVENPGGRIYVESLANELAVHLLRYYSTLERPVKDPTRKLPQYKLRRAIDYINDNLRSGLTIKKIAQKLSMSPGYFAHTFSQTTGLAPHQYIVECRIERAKLLLRETELPIAEVAEHVGFSTQSHFATAFHRLTGLPPGQYRRQE
jgi:AraC family transcriptional regulator